MTRSLNQPLYSISHSVTGSCGWVQRHLSTCTVADMPLIPLWVRFGGILAFAEVNRSLCLRVSQHALTNNVPVTLMMPQSHTEVAMCHLRLVCVNFQLNEADMLRPLCEKRYHNTDVCENQPHSWLFSNCCYNNSSGLWWHWHCLVWKLSVLLLGNVDKGSLLGLNSLWKGFNKII